MTTDGQRVVVTGAGRGIGRATAERLAPGAHCHLVARSADQLAEAAEACRARGAASVHVHPCDLTDRDALAELVAAVSDVDVLVANAGIAPSAPFERTDDALWDRVFALNVHAPFALARAWLPGMAARGAGRVVVVASTAALEGFAYTSAYCASKHAALGLVRALAAELDQRHADGDLAVAAVCPGFVDTDIVRASAERIAAATGCSLDEARERLGAMNAGGALLTPADVAGAIADLVDAPRAEAQGRTVTWDD